ncbi:MAG: site-2 protease family protein [Planctomycetota bacterium]
MLRLNGIPIRVHRWLLILMAVLVLGAGFTGQGWNTLAAAGSAAALLVLTATVLVHELGHALVARRHGVDVVDITLWPLGGMAHLRNMPEDARVEARIAFAGPLTNLLIGGACLLAWTANQGKLDWQSLMHTEVRTWAGLLSFAALCNLLLGAFNLLPAFPMDGGKILRSALAPRNGWLGATEIAARVGRTLAFLMAAIAFFNGSIALFLVAAYIFFAGSRELWSTRLRHMAPSGSSLADLLRNLQRQAAGSANTREEDTTPDQPSGPELRTGPTSSGFTDEEIEAMERHHGKLPRE